MNVIIDVSEHNKTLDWEVIKAQCARHQIPFGVYLFSYARNEQEAIDEAQHTLRLVKD